MKRVLFVCGGNTCRSPMAKVILERILKERGLESKISVDSAARGIPTHPAASDDAREAINKLYGMDLLANHKSKSINEISLDDFHIILTMQEKHKQGLPGDKTYTLKEYAGLKGDITDPYGQGLKVYIKRSKEIESCLVQAIERLIRACLEKRARK